MEVAVKKILGTKLLKDTGIGGSGCISAGSTYLTDAGPVFIKINHEKQAKEMFEGEKAGLEAILATKTVRVPKPRCIASFGGGSSSALVMESVRMKSLNSRTQALLGERLANLHQHNILLLTRNEETKTDAADAELTSKSESSHIDADGDHHESSILKAPPIRQFGFHVPTSCGYIQQSNHWDDNWTRFFVEQKLGFQVHELWKKRPDEELVDAWEPCKKSVEVILNKIKPLPSLLHGDLWSGNASSVDDEPIIYDPAAFYGHSEYDLGIANMFGGFSQDFYNAYHKILPRQEGFEKRLEIYELFHHLNHWNHFGSQYRRSSLELMHSIAGDYD